MRWFRVYLNKKEGNEPSRVLDVELDADDVEAGPYPDHHSTYTLTESGSEKVTVGDDEVIEQIVSVVLMGDPVT